MKIHPVDDRLVTALLLALMSSACGTGDATDGGGRTPSLAAFCEKVCAEAERCRVGFPPEYTCGQRCTDSYGKPKAECSALLDEYKRCAIDVTWECTGNGVKPPGCDLAPFSSCQGD
jgi:hypothetical protein